MSIDNCRLQIVNSPPARPEGRTAPLSNGAPVSGFSTSGASQPQRSPVAAWEWALLAQTLVLACVVRWLWVDFDLDDSFITYAYSRSLAEGHGFVFAGQKALGTTTPLYALLLGVFSFAGAPMVETAKALGLLGALASCVLAWGLTRTLMGPWAGLAASALLAVNARHAAVSMSGMETSLYAAVCLGALCAFLWERPYWTAALASIACLLRPDGVILAAVLFVAHFAARRKFQWGPPLVFLLPLAVWIGYAYLEFGSPIPTSVTAKLAYPEYGRFKLEVAAAILGAPLAIPLATLSVIGLFHALLAERRLLPLAAWAVLYLGAFLRAPNFPWYYVPPIAALLILGIAGVFSVLTVFVPWEGRGWSALRGIVCLGLAGGLGWYTTIDFRQHREYLARTYGPEVTQAYHSMALWLRDNTLPDAVVAVPEVGYVGYYSERRVLDLAGLCSPQVIPYLPARRYVEILQDFQPDFVAITTESGRPIHNAIDASEWFHDHYNGAVKFPYRGRWYIVYRKRAHPREPAGPPAHPVTAPPIPSPKPASPESALPAAGALAGASQLTHTR